MSKSETIGLILSIGVFGVGLVLAVWTWRDRGHHLSAVTEQDRRHFANQEIRRWVVSGTMVLLAVGVYAGTRIPHKLAGRPNLLFLQTWLWVILLVFVLLVLAAIDWFATRVYGNRQRKAMLREGIDILRDEYRARSALRQNGTTPGESNGIANGSPPVS